MADTSQQQQQEALEPPQTNGAVDGLTEEEKSKMRPADIDAVSILYSITLVYYALYIYYTHTILALHPPALVDIQ